MSHSIKTCQKETGMATMVETWSFLGSLTASFMFILAMVQRFVPFEIRDYLRKYSDKWLKFVYPYVYITFHEYTGDQMKRSETYDFVRSYLMAISSTKARRLKAEMVENTQSLLLSMEDNEQVTDKFEGVKLWWSSSSRSRSSSVISLYPAADDNKLYTVSFHRRHRQIITGSYLDFVMKKGKSITVENRERRLYTNNPSNNWSGYKRTKWSYMPFEHPATFETLAMDPKKKKEIIDDLRKFSKGKEFYAKIGKAWKRGYLLYGPPGTGKSTMIAAMANFLSYDVYDLELTAVKENSDLRQLLIETPRKSVIVIEDIDCSLDLTGQRKKKKEKEEEEANEESSATKKIEKWEDLEEKSKVTLSGLLNFIDGLWSSCGGEKIIVFTTNHVEKLDPALIRRGRMDKHIELSYCCFEGFKVLAKNYLDVESHELFERIERLMKETNMTPADVTENLTPKSEDDDAEACLKSVVEALEMAKEKAALKEVEVKQDDDQ